MITHRSLRSGFLALPMAGMLLLSATGCSDDDGAPSPNEKPVAGTKVCGGNAVSPEASRALKVITGTSRFAASSEKSSIAKAATNIIDSYPDIVSLEDICRIFTAPGEREFQLRITWDMDQSPPKGDFGSKFTVLKMGEQTVASSDSAYVEFACRGARLPDSLGLSYLEIGVKRWLFSAESEADPEALKYAYATVAHSVALALAKELRCEKNGGLPERPVLKST